MGVLRSIRDRLQTSPATGACAGALILVLSRRGERGGKDVGSVGRDTLPTKTAPPPESKWLQMRCGWSEPMGGG